MNRRYQIVDRPDRHAAVDPARLAMLLAKDGQLLLPLLDLIVHAEAAVDDLIDVMGRATLEAVLLMSAEAVARPRQQGKKVDRDLAYHGSQGGRVALKERQLRVSRPRLLEKSRQPGESGEVEDPGYCQMLCTGVDSGGVLDLYSIDELDASDHVSEAR